MGQHKSAAGMLAEMREQGSTGEQIKELITKENYDNFLKISAPMSTRTALSWPTGQPLPPSS